MVKMSSNVSLFRCFEIMLLWSPHVPAFSPVSNYPREFISSRKTMIFSSPAASHVGEWLGLGLSPLVAEAASRQRFGSPTAIQRAAIPAVLHGRDVWAEASTGSGKTAAFVLPLLQRLQGDEREATRSTSGLRIGPRVLVVVPTRELATQVFSVDSNAHVAFYSFQ